MPPHFRQLANEEVDDLNSISNLSQGNWLMASEEVMNYRRRKIPSYILSKDVHQQPTYICQSTLSFAFSNVNSIKLVVDLNQYKSELKDFQSSFQILKYQQISSANKNNEYQDAINEEKGGNASLNQGNNKQSGNPVQAPAFQSDNGVHHPNPVASGNSNSPTYNNINEKSSFQCLRLLSQQQPGACKFGLEIEAGLVTG